MAKHNLTQSAQLVGLTRQTITEHLKTKGISVERDDKGRPFIDTAELIRVYGPLRPLDSKPDGKSLRSLTPANDRQSDTLHAELDALRREKLETLQARLDEVAAERDEWREQAQRLARLLVDQREAAPEPAPSAEPAAAPPGRIETPGELVEVEAAKLDPMPDAETSIAGAGKGAGALSWLLAPFRRGNA